MASFTPALEELTSGLRFPEGPMAMPDGSVILVEIERQTLSRVTPDGKVHVVAKLGGGPNGAAMGPNGKIYVTNNGGFEWLERPGRLFPVAQARLPQGGGGPGDRALRDHVDCDGRRCAGPTISCSTTPAASVHRLADPETPTAAPSATRGPTAR
jgi:gluconolactonase